MGKKRARLMAIENKKSRSDTFHKRKMGLLKKAAEFAILCDVKLLLLFEDLAGSIIQFSAHEHFDPKVYQDKKIVKLSLTDYPDFFQKHGPGNEQGDKVNHGGADAQESDNEDGDEDDDSNSNSSERAPRQSNDQDEEAKNSALQKKGSGWPAQFKIGFGGVDVKAEHGSEVMNLKTENIQQNFPGSTEFKNQLETLQKSLKNINQSSEDLPNMMSSAMQNMPRPDAMSMFPPMKDMNPFMAGMDPTAMSMAASRFPFMGFDPTMMMRNMDPMMLGMMRASMPEAMRSKFGEPNPGEDPNKWMMNYYETYFKQAMGGGSGDQKQNMDAKNNAGDDVGGKVKKKVKKQDE